MSDIRVNRILKYTTADGRGLRYSLYTQGCLHKCEGCHNPQTHSPQGGIVMSVEEIAEDILNTPHITGITVTGGDPLYQYEAVTELCRSIRENSNLNIILYTGYTYEVIEQMYTDILSFVDYIVDGKFEKSLAVAGLYFRGSSNQNFIDVRATCAASQMVTAAVGKRQIIT